MNEIGVIRKQFGAGCVEVLERVPMDIDELVAWYLSAELAFVSTFWDGLNLTPYEYTASQHEDNPGMSL
jgi:trehalose-6-phosphate synthase